MKKLPLIVKIITLSLACVFVLSSCGTASNQTPTGSEPTEDPSSTQDPGKESEFDPVEGYGLHIEKDGTVTLGGEVFFGYGTNWHGAFSVAQGNATENRLSKFFQVLKDGGIPYIRIMMGVFYPDQVSTYTEKHDKYFEKMDIIVKLAEKYNVGIIASLMWNDSTFYIYSGETLKQLGDPEAAGTKLAVQYVTEVVTRYKDSPAVWAWEIGNEGNLGVDLWPEHGVVHSSAQLMDYYNIIGNAIHAVDGYRMISGGDGCPRPYSYSLRNGDGWGYRDTVEMSVDSLQYYNPGYLRAASMHVYGYEDADRFADLVKACKQLNLCCYVGEFGTGGSVAIDSNEEITAEEQEAINCWNYVFDTLVANDIQLATQWCFGRCAEQMDPTSIEVGMTSKMYQNTNQWDKLVEINKNFVEEGKNKSAAYWASAENLLYKE